MASFGSVAKLVKVSKCKKRDVEEWLSGQNTYILHKIVRKRFPLNPYTVKSIDDVWEMDLTDLSSLSKYNDRHKYLLNVIDIYSRYAWSVFLKDKTGASFISALKFLFQSRKPITIQSHKGTEFFNASVQQHLNPQRLNFHTSHTPDIKGAVTE